MSNETDLREKIGCMFAEYLLFMTVSGDIDTGP